MIGLSRVDLHIRGGRLQLQGNRIENKADVTAIFRAVGDLNHLAFRHIGERFQKCLAILNFV